MQRYYNLFKFARPLQRVVIAHSATNRIIRNKDTEKLLPEVEKFGKDIKRSTRCFQKELMEVKQKIKKNGEEKQTSLSASMWRILTSIFLINWLFLSSLIIGKVTNLMLEDLKHSLSEKE